MTLTVYNSLSRRKEVFVPLEPGAVGIYVCGPTVYGHCHIGHAKSYISFDVIVKWLRRHYSVRYVQNITDVGHLTDDADQGEDKIGRLARLEKVHPLEIVDHYMRSYFEDMASLGVADPNMYVRATQHILEQIELTQSLIDRGHAYVVGGNVYFDVGSWPDYGALSGRRPEDQVESGRVETRSDKRDPRDFALWKSAEGTSHILRWKSPWSDGYPGWHIECSAMAMKYLGESFDIHGGGVENKFPHHECEIAQSRAACGGSFARYWLHNNMINVDGQKMGKSLGNSVYIKEALKKFGAAAMRLFILQTQYGRPSNYTEDALAGNVAGTQRLAEVMRLLERTASKGADSGPADDALARAIEKSKAEFDAAMNDDFNTPVAISTLFELTTVVNSEIGRGASGGVAGSLLAYFNSQAGELLGILPASTGAADSEFTDKVMKVLLDVRGKLRQEKNWSLSDFVRDRCQDIGVTVKDEKDGSVTWTKT